VVSLRVARGAERRASDIPRAYIPGHTLAMPWPCPGHALVRACGQRPLARDQMISDRTRRFAKWSAICSFALGMAGQVAYHLMAQAGMARAPWPVTTVVACLPVLVLAMGAALAHMLRADAEAAYAPGSRTGPPAVLRSMSLSVQEQAGAVRREPGAGRDQSASRDHASPGPGPQHGRGITGPGPRPAHGQAEQARMVARRLAAAGRPVSRRALRSGGVTGSNLILSPDVSWGCDLRRRIADSVVDGTRAA